MDGWMGEWVGGWEGGRMDGRVDGCKVEHTTPSRPFPIDLFNTSMI